MSNNRIHPDSNESKAEELKRMKLFVTGFVIKLAREWVPEAIHTITLISEGRKLGYTTVEQCALVTCGAACATLGFSLLCFGTVCCKLGSNLCAVAQEGATEYTRCGFHYTADIADFVQPAFDHFQLRFEALMAIERPTRDEMRRRYKMVDWVIKTCTAMKIQVSTDLAPVQVIEFLRTSGLIRAN